MRSLGKFIVNSSFTGTIDLIHLRKKLVKGGKLLPHQPFLGLLRNSLVCLCQSVHATEVSETMITLSRKCVCMQWQFYCLLCPFPGQLLVLNPKK